MVRSDSLPVLVVRSDSLHVLVVRSVSLPVLVVRSDSLPVLVVRSDSLPVLVVRSDVLLPRAEHGVELSHPAPHLWVAVHSEGIPTLQLTASSQTLANHAAVQNV